MKNTHYVASPAIRVTKNKYASPRNATRETYVILVRILLAVAAADPEESNTPPAAAVGLPLASNGRQTLQLVVVHR